MIAFIALAKGELGKEIEKYLRCYEIALNLEGRPLRYRQRIGNRIFDIMQSKDVPRYVDNPEGADYGITGSDLVMDYMLGTRTSGKNNNIRISEKLGFGKGDLVIFEAEEPLAKSKSGKVIVAVPNYYANLLRYGRGAKFIKDAYGEFEPYIVYGSTESFVRRRDNINAFSFCLC